MNHHNVVYTPERLASANGIEIAYDIFGEPTDPAMLLIMGLGVQLIGWDAELCRQIATRGYYVIRYDNRDVGHSTKFDAAGIPRGQLLLQALVQGRPDAVPAAYRLEDMARDAIALLDELRISRAHVVGASMGGMIAQVLAIHYPERVRTLTCLSSSSGDPNLPPPAPEALTALLTPPPREREAYIEHAVANSRVLTGPVLPFDAERARRLAAQAYDRSFYPAGAARHFAAIAASVGWKADLPGLEMPVLVIHGDQDPLVPLAAGRDIATTIPDARFHVAEGSGHTMPPVTWPDLVTHLLAHTQ